MQVQHGMYKVPAAVIEEELIEHHASLLSTLIGITSEAIMLRCSLCAVLILQRPSSKLYDRLDGIEDKTVRIPKRL